MVLPPLMCLLAVISAALAEEQAYLGKVGERVTVFENLASNYRLDLDGEAYTYVNFSEQVPEASFAAIRFQPNAFSIVVSENLGVGPDAEQYAEMVQYSMEEQINAREGAEYTGHKDLGWIEVDGREYFQKAVYAEINSLPITYVMSTTVDGARAYQLLTFATSEDEAVVKVEADKLVSGFAVLDPAANENIVADARSVDDYRSPVFAYRYRALGNGWFGWADLAETNDGADIGALSARGYGSVVMPVCWQGDRPTDNAVFRVMMQQFGEDYPSDFIRDEHEVSTGDASGKLFIGTEASEGQDYLYHQWIVINDSCAYTLAAWGPAGRKGVKKELSKLWSAFEVLEGPTSIQGDYRNDRERAVNAYLLNALGLHYYDARSFRDAHRFFSQASDLQSTDATFLTNAVRALAEIDAYKEATEWLQPRLAPFDENQLVQSWDAWLAYQTNDPQKAIRIYEQLFESGYREDDDFSAYVGLLAEADAWDAVDRAFADYTTGGINDKTRMLKVQLLSRREKFDEALALLDEMTDGRPFNADLAYERMSILDAKGSPAEVLQLAESLIENGYRSLQSYYHKGNSEYQLRSYKAARESLETALTFAPGNTNIRDFIAAIDLTLGQGDVSMISHAIEAVALPKGMQKIFSANDADTGATGYGAEYLSRISGYDYSGGTTRTETQYRKIRVVDDNGISQFSTLEFDFDPSYEQLYVNSLRVRSAAGKILAEGDLDTYYITHNEDGYEASTEKTVHLPVPSLSPGAVIEAVVSKLTSVESGSFPLETIYLATDRPIGYSAVFVRGDTENLQFQSRELKAPRKRGGVLVWELQTPVSYRWEPLQPYFDQILPWVQLGTVGDDWQTVGAEYLSKIEDKLDASSVAERAERLIDGIESRSRRIEVLSAYVQNEVHYEAIEFGRRAYIPKTARETLRDRYGDCKDHAVLLHTMLQAVGIESSIALVNLQQKIVPSLPNTDQFNHVIVSVPSDGGNMFIDTTDKDLRLGKLPPRSMAGNYALVLGKASELIQIPGYEAGLTGLIIERVVDTDAEGLLKVTETARFSAYQAAEFRGQLRTIETSEMQTSLQRWIASRYSDAELIDYFVENIFDTDYDLIVEITYTLPLEADGSFDSPGFLEAYYLEFDRVADRRFPFEFFYPLRVSATTSIKFPPGGRLNSVSAKPNSAESRFGTWRREVDETSDAWKIRFDYVASDERFQPEDYREFAEFQRTAVDVIEQPLLLQ